MPLADRHSILSSDVHRVLKRRFRVRNSQALYLSKAYDGFSKSYDLDWLLMTSSETTPTPAYPVLLRG
jgi:hypothetical protein